MKLVNNGNMGHAGRFDINAQWERSFHRYFWTQRQLAWTEVAKSKYEWRQHRESYVQWRLDRLYTRTRKMSAEDISTESSQLHQDESDEIDSDL